MKEIELTQGKFAIIDDEDFELVNQRNWSLSHGYARAGTRDRKAGTQKSISMHRIIMNCPEGFEVDHINGNKLDNRKANLRICTIQQNRANTPGQSLRKNEFKGVFQRSTNGKFRALITVNKKQLSLGDFDTQEEAAKAYDEAALKTWGEFAQLNYP